MTFGQSLSPGNEQREFWGSEAADRMGSRNVGGIKDMRKLPDVLFVIDPRKEDIAVNEAQKLNIPIFAMVDTNSDPNKVDFAIPANDDASKSIRIIAEYITGKIKEGLEERPRGLHVPDRFSPAGLPGLS